MGRQLGAQRVVIAVAGPIGAVLACAVRKRHIPVVLIEALYVLQWEQYKIVRTVLQRLRNDPDAEVRRQRRKAQVDYVRAQSIQNKQTRGETDPVERVRKLDQFRRQSNDPELHDAFIRRACSIDSLREGNATA